MSEADKIIKSLRDSGKKVEEFYVSNKTSDENVANIEELIQEYKTYNDLDGIQDLSIYINALENILAEREQKDKRIQELEAKLLDMIQGTEIINKETPEYVKENYIPKQKIKDLLTEIQEEYNKLDKEIDKQITDKNKDYYKCKENIAIMQTLAYCRDKFEGLLEEK